jgi:hypothetical protein
MVNQDDSFDNFLGLFIRQSFHEPQINDKTNHFKRIIVMNLIFIWLENSEKFITILS